MFEEPLVPDAGEKSRLQGVEESVEPDDLFGESVFENIRQLNVVVSDLSVVKVF